MKKNTLLLLILIFTISCNLSNDCGECFTPPRQFNFDFVDAKVLVVDLDEGCLKSRVGDEGRVIPRRIQKALSTVLHSEEAGTQSV